MTVSVRVTKPRRRIELSCSGGAAIASVPIPVDNGAPCRAVATTLPDGTWTAAWRRNSGLTLETFGPSFGHDPKAACRAAAAINARSGQA